MKRKPDLNKPCGVWIKGLAGCGKSFEARNSFPDHYPKMANNWWDQYQDQDVVILEDVDKFMVSLGGKIKIWADEYNFVAEIKNGSLRIRPKLFIITSQYSIEDIWTDDETRDALLRRFTVVTKLDRDIAVLTPWLPVVGFIGPMEEHVIAP